MSQTTNTNNPDDNKIKPLSSDVVNRIAAGEVIERPANAIKEMLENSLDAGANSITIEVCNAGLKYIQITDNGCGIGAKDLEIVCERHTTSKLTNFEDLRTISTFGFRGEALASISYCAQVTICSKTESQKCAVKGQYKDGKLIGSLKSSAGVRGTTIRAENLFYNLPQRREALSVTTEFKKISDVVTKYALFYSGKSITLKKQGESKPIIHTSINSDTIHNIKTLYGSKISKEILEMDHKHEKLEYNIHAFFTNVNFSSKEKQFILFINKRLVDHSALKKAVISVFEPYLPKKGYPFVFVKLEMNPRHLDVNMHPTKKEVAFLNEEQIIDDIKEEIRKKLLGSNSSRVFKPTATNSSTLSTSTVNSSKIQDLEEELENVNVPNPSASLVTPPKQSFSRSTISDELITQQTTQMKSPILPSVPPKKDYPHNKVRTSVDDQTGQMDLYVNSQKRKTITEEEYQPLTKKKKQEDSDEENVDDLNSLLELRGEIQGNTHDELKLILKKSVYVGWINPTFSLIQFNDKLLLFDMNTISKHLCYQHVIKKFGKFRKIVFDTPLDISTMVRTKLSTDGEISEEDTNNSLIGEITTTLQQKSELLEEYFSIGIDKGKLSYLPQVLPNHIPPLHRIPDFLVALVRGVDWTDEKACFKTISMVVSDFYRLSESNEIDQFDTQSTSSSQQLNSQDSTSSTSGSKPVYTKEKLQWITEHVIYPLCKVDFYPPNELATGGCVMEIANLPDLFKIFERC
ncbi:hypothetical protein ABK040_002347 [Willaertia magna]